MQYQPGELWGDWGRLKGDLVIQPNEIGISKDRRVCLKGRPHGAEGQAALSVGMQSTSVMLVFPAFVLFRILQRRLTDVSVTQKLAHEQNSESVLDP